MEEFSRRSYKKNNISKSDTRICRLFVDICSTLSNWTQCFVKHQLDREGQEWRTVEASEYYRYMPNARSAFVNFREREIRSMLYVARNFPPRSVLPLCSQPRSLLAVSRVECVKQGETLYYSLVRVKQDERMKISDLVHEIRAVLSNIDIENLSITLKKLHASRSIEINLVQ